MKTAITIALTLFATASMAEGLQDVYDLPDGYEDIVINLPAEGSISEADGLAAFERIYEVATSPRCANCHVGSDNIPIWSGPNYGDKPRPHGMDIHAGESRIGAESVQCSTCHITTTDLNSAPHEPPHFGIAWQLAPVEFEWFGKSPQDICLQLKNPETNGGRDWQGLVDHLGHDATLSGPVLWSWHPGEGREPAPGSLQEHVNDVISWGAAGQPCPDDSQTNSEG